jgi:hypothetical protein
MAELPRPDLMTVEISPSGSNRYTQYLVSDNELCVPVLDRDQLAALLSRTEQIADVMGAAGVKPGVAFDLEHLQVADYAAFPPITPQQQEAIRRLQAAEPIRPDELAYLALRSFVDLFWDEPQSEDDVRRAVLYNAALERALEEQSPSVGRVLDRHDAPLPYWGRLGFLRVMAAIPDEQLDALDMGRFACVLLKDRAFNARSFQYGEFGLVGLNYALEPILKSLNRMVLHFHHTHANAGPRRLERAWAALVRIVAYFWNRQGVPANRLLLSQPAFDKSIVATAHALTASQVDFVIRHELGHLVLDHAGKLRDLDGDPATKMALRHEFEFAADAFAQGALRSALYHRLRGHVQWGVEADGVAAVERWSLQALHDHQAEVTAVRLLFAYMDAIDRAGSFLKGRLGEAVDFRSQLDSHPSPRDRLARLDASHVGQAAPTSQLLRYAQSFLADAQAYAASLDDAQLRATMSGVT